MVQFNDVFTLAGPAYGGICADQTGVNGNLSLDPAFVAAEAGDYRLQFGSPVIDAGNSTATDVPAADLDGNPRVMDGNGEGVAAVDMGAYERPSGPVSRGAVADSILAPNSKNLNDGANPMLVVDTHRTIVAFDLAGVSPAGLTRVTLRLTLAEPATRFPHGCLPPRNWSARNG